jgi:DNA-binding LytR/AlgR family response regulator
MKMRCIIVDDEPLAREGMERLVNDAGIFELVATCMNALEANKILSREKIDLMFLDIQMPGMRGIDFLKTLQTKPLVIITTAYPNFALEGFELNVLDYLVKPITTERFLKAVNRASELTDGRSGEKQPGKADFFFIRSASNYEKVFFNEILYIEASQNYMTVHTEKGKLMALITIKSLEEQLPSKKFLRIHKSYIISLEKITALRGNEVVIGTQKIPVGKNYKEELLKIVNERLIGK